jgi:AcrR family transcriptional regulator
MGTRLSRARPSSRDAILRVFADLVAQKGFSDTSIGDVAAHLGLSKGTVVHHFGTKDQLLSEVHAEYFKRRFAEADYIMAKLEKPDERLSAFLYALLACHRDDRSATLTFLREFVRYTEGGLSEQVRSQRRRYKQLVVGVIEDGVRQGVFSTPDSSTAALQIFGMCNYAWTWYQVDGRLSCEDIARIFAQNIVYGLHRSGSSAQSVELEATMERAIRVVQETPGRLPELGDRKDSDMATPAASAALR